MPAQPASPEVRMKRLEHLRRAAADAVKDITNYLRQIEGNLDNLGPINHAILSAMDEAEFEAAHEIAKPYLYDLRSLLSELGPQVEALQGVAEEATKIEEGEKESDLDWAVGEG